MPKKQKKRTFTIEEYIRLLKTAKQLHDRFLVRWDILILLAVITGMRKSELLNSVWSDIDFKNKTIEVTPKRDTDQTWYWTPKDADYRILPLTDSLVSLLAKHRSNRSVGYPYIFVHPCRYDHILQLRRQNKWKPVDARLKIVNNFTREFKQILKLSNVKYGRFHDLRSTALSKMFEGGLKKYDLMNIAGHSKFETTEEFYLSVQDDLVGRAREAIQKGFGPALAHIWHAPYSGEPNEKS